MHKIKQKQIGFLFNEETLILKTSRTIIIIFAPHVQRFHPSSIMEVHQVNHVTCHLGPALSWGKTQH
jgi:hypothetical protein